MGLGAVEPLSRLISHEDQSVRRNAFMALGNMASNGKADTLFSMTFKIEVAAYIIEWTF